LHKHIEGKSKKEAAGIILDFVQTALDYQTDEQQFGEVCDPTYIGGRVGEAMPR